VFVSPAFWDAPKEVALSAYSISYTSFPFPLRVLHVACNTCRAHILVFLTGLLETNLLATAAETYTNTTLSFKVFYFCGKITERRCNQHICKQYGSEKFEVRIVSVIN
jgi:hypothetical protein